MSELHEYIPNKTEKKKMRHKSTKQFLSSSNTLQPLKATVSPVLDRISPFSFISHETKSPDFHEEQIFFPLKKN